MKVCKTLFAAITLIAAVTLGSSSAQAQAPGRHPAYLRALSDLRMMRGYLDRLTPDERIDDEQQQAVNEIDAAIHEIVQASIDDGKDLRFHPPIDARILPENRFRNAREAGNAAWRDVNQAEDDGYARGLKHRAMDHIERANHLVDHIIDRLKHHHF